MLGANISQVEDGYYRQQADKNAADNRWLKFIVHQSPSH